MASDAWRMDQPRPLQAEDEKGRNNASIDKEGK